MSAESETICGVESAQTFNIGANEQDARKRRFKRSSQAVTGLAAPSTCRRGAAWIFVAISRSVQRSGFRQWAWRANEGEVPAKAYVLRAGEEQDTFVHSTSKC